MKKIKIILCLILTISILCASSYTVSAETPNDDSTNTILLVEGDQTITFNSEGL